MSTVESSIGGRPGAQVGKAHCLEAGGLPVRPSRGALSRAMHKAAQEDKTRRWMDRFVDSAVQRYQLKNMRACHIIYVGQRIAERGKAIQDSEGD